MPELSRFYGIVIKMFYDDHNPPYFHVEYGGNKAVIEIATLNITQGKFPRRALNLVREWASQHEEELLANWQLGVAEVPFTKIDPLP
jgi:Domain of unknown function (DUF4160)